MKSFKQYLEEAINYDSLELDNSIKFRLRSETKNIQIPLTPESEKKLKSLWADWKDILTINGEIAKLQKLSKKTALSAYVKRYVVITKADLSSQKSYEDKLSDESSHKQMSLGPNSRKRVDTLKTDGISSLEIISKSQCTWTTRRTHRWEPTASSVSLFPDRPSLRRAR